MTEDLTALRLLVKSIMVHALIGVNTPRYDLMNEANALTAELIKEVQPNDGTDPDDH